MEEDYEEDGLSADLDPIETPDYEEGSDEDITSAAPQQMTPEQRKWFSTHGNELKAGREARERLQAVEAEKAQLLSYLQQRQSSTPQEQPLDGVYAKLNEEERREWDALIGSTPLTRQMRQQLEEITQANKQVLALLQNVSTESITGKFNALEKELGVSLPDDERWILQQAYSSGNKDAVTKAESLVKKALGKQSVDQAKRRRSAGQPPGGSGVRPIQTSPSSIVDGKFNFSKSWETASRIAANKKR